LLSGHAPIVRNRAKAIALGKALFWDTQVGSDGMACASCHFHAGADARVKNQLSPGRPTGSTFEPTASGAAGGPNYTLRLADFPFHQPTDPADFSSPVRFTTSDVAGSAGTFGGDFRGPLGDDSAFDDCAPIDDPVFAVHGVRTRRVTSRNAPSIINTVFNRRNFWDGRASSVFNGVNGAGPRDPDARVWMWRKGRLRAKQLALPNASLASQAVEPPLDTNEMSCTGRAFADIGRKLLPRRPLRLQTVHPDDGVLRGHRHPSGQGLRSTYAKLIRGAFDRRYWAAPQAKTKDALGGYTQMETNFALFFGIAVQLYESTLVSDQAPFDSRRDDEGVPTALDQQQRRGLGQFVDLHCSECHRGATLSGGEATLTDVDRKPIRSASGAQTLGLVDTGFVNTGVAAPENDAGVGGAGASGRPLSFTMQWLDLLRGASDPAADTMTVRSCAMTSPFAIASFGLPAFPAGELVGDPAGGGDCTAPRWAVVPSPQVTTDELAKVDQGRLTAGISAAFKVPSLRNVELTGPYMHNGGMATLEQVLEFYGRGGNVASHGKDTQFLFGVGIPDAIKADLLAFLRSLTDERVRLEQAPFDHPSLPLPSGHVGDQGAVLGSPLAETESIELPAVGASGRGTLGPLRPFAELMQP
jgi:cytochrome c peroxidase